jgi:hypothetical protein
LSFKELWLFAKIMLEYSNRLPYVWAMKNKHAQALGRLGGLAGTGKAKARKVTSEQARAAVMARWNKPGARKNKKAL